MTSGFGEKLPQSKHSIRKDVGASGPRRAMSKLGNDRFHWILLAKAAILPVQIQQSREIKPHLLKGDTQRNTGMRDTAGSYLENTIVYNSHIFPQAKMCLLLLQEIQDRSPSHYSIAPMPRVASAKAGPDTAIILQAIPWISILSTIYHSRTNCALKAQTIHCTLVRSTIGGRISSMDIPSKGTKFRRCLVIAGP